MSVQNPVMQHRLRMHERKPELRLKRPRSLGPPGSAVSPLMAPRVTRRGMLGALAGGPGPPVRPRDPVLTLVHRITQGFNLAEYQHARSLGYDGYLEEQLDHLSIDDSALDARLAGFTTLNMSPKEIVDNFPDDITLPYYEIKGAVLLRSVFSKRQLFERMVEFWNDHFNLDHNKGDFLYVFKPEDDRTVIRPNALGSFYNLLYASSHSAAMLFYLDNWLSYAGAIQENYARELMELHTLGVNGGYTENDVTEVAKCLTGWTLNGDYYSPDYLRAKFEPSYHEAGPKYVLGNTIPGTPGRQDLTHVIDILTAHPSTAQFLSSKLIRWFLTETPPQSLIDEVAQAYVNTYGDIKSMLRVILAEHNLKWASPVYGAKFRRPFHLMTSILRGLNADVTDFYYPLFYLVAMGHSPFDWIPPNGYPDTVNVWGNLLLSRWTFLSHLVDGYVYGVQLPAPAQLAALLGASGPQGRAGLAQRINERILGETLSSAEVESVQQFIDSLGGPLAASLYYGASVGQAKVYQAVALAASMPGYQGY